MRNSVPHKFNSWRTGTELNAEAALAPRSVQLLAPRLVTKKDWIRTINCYENLLHFGTQGITTPCSAFDSVPHKLHISGLAFKATEAPNGKWVLKRVDTYLRRPRIYEKEASLTANN